MTTKLRQAYGTWQSPLSPKMMAGTMRLMDVQWDSDGETLVWAERRAGVSVLVAQTGTEAPRDLTDASVSVVGRVGYGGGEFAVAHGYAVYAAGGRLYRVPLGYGQSVPITPAMGGSASPSLSPDGRWVAYVNSYEDQDRLLCVDAEGARLPHVLASGSDFVMQPVWHPSGEWLAYVAWNHPNMPFLGTELRLIKLGYDAQGAPYPVSEVTLAGGERVAVLQPQFSPDGKWLAYLSDETGWGHLFLYDLETRRHTQVTHGEAEHSTPAWVQGIRQYGWSDDSRTLFCIRSQQGFHSLLRYDVQAQTSTALEGLRDYTAFQQVSVAPRSGRLAFFASSAVIGGRVVVYHPDEGVRVVRRATLERVAPSDLAQAEAITWQGHDGETVHGLYYAPTNPRYEGEGAPPLLVLIHGGPTSQRWASYSDEVQYFATRGYAVLQVNHRGSTGYGRAYMEKHHLYWGVYDVEDARTGALALAARGLADAGKFIIMGSSAGGYTVLQTLTTYPNVFKAGVNAYGIANQFTLALDTHKFESRYSDWLLGALPQSADRWRERSPIFRASAIKDALIVFQGSADAVVPPSQSEAIVSALKRNGVPHEYYLYEGEGHGFSKPATLEDFYGKLERFLLQYVLYA